MHNRIFFRILKKGNRFDVRPLSLCYLCGLILGCATSYIFSDFYTSDLIIQMLDRPSVWGLLFVNLVPSVLAACFLFYSLNILCWPILFVHSVFFGFVGTTVSVVFGNSAWLIRPLLMYSCGLSALCLWLLLICKAFFLRKNCILVLFVILLGISFIDYFFVSRFLSNLIAFY